MPEDSTIIVFDLGRDIRISPPTWSADPKNVHPSDLSQIAPQGNGVYGYDPSKQGDPFKGAPSMEGRGGVIYFENDITRPDFEALMRVFGIHHRRPLKGFAIFMEESKQPGKDGYLVQARIVSKFGLRFLFRTINETEYERFEEQPVDTVDALWAFIEHERKRWGTSFTQDGQNGLRGLFGGDGDSAREELSFGIMVENDYHQVYRIWSRAWLVTK